MEHSHELPRSSWPSPPSGSFSRPPRKLHRTQSAVSQALRRLEDELGERLFDRSSQDGRLTEAGRVLQDYAERLMRLAEEAETAVRELRDLQRGRVLIGANEAPCTACCRSSRGSASATRASTSTSAACTPATSASRSSGEPRLRHPHVPARRAGLLQSRRSTPTTSCCSCRPAIRSPAPAVPHGGGRPAARSSRTTIRRRRATGCCALRAAARAAQHPRVAAEPRRHQAGGGNGPRRRAPAAALRGRRDRRAANWWRSPCRTCAGRARSRLVYRTTGAPLARAPRVPEDRAGMAGSSVGARRPTPSRAMYGQPRPPRRAPSVEIGEQQRRGVPRARRGTPRARRGRASWHGAVRRRPRTSAAARSTTTARRRGCARRRHQRLRSPPRATTVTHGTPSAVALPKKISANDSPTIARMPQRREALRRVLARRPAAEVAVHEEHAPRPRSAGRRTDARPACRARRAVVLEHVRLEAVEADGAQEPRRHDAVGVDVVARAAARPRPSTCGCSSQVIAFITVPPAASSARRRTSPAIAAAATIAGLISSVRPVGLPCRPLKFRFDDEAHISPARRAGRGSSPGTSSSRRRATRTRPRGRPRAGPRARPRVARAASPARRAPARARATRRPRRTRAASRRSDSRPFVHDPMNATSTRVPAIGRPPSRPMNAQRLVDAPRSVAAHRRMPGRARRPRPTAPG